MCLITHLMKEPLIATEDIKVFKVLLKYSDYYSTRENTAPFYQLYTYHKGLNVPIHKVFGVEMGPGTANSSGIYEDGWLHAFTSRSEAERMAAQKRCYKVVEMYIPKGAKYFIGDEYDIGWKGYIETDEICASALYWPNDDNKL